MTAIGPVSFSGNFVKKKSKLTQEQVDSISLDDKKKLINTMNTLKSRTERRKWLPGGFAESDDTVTARINMRSVNVVRYYDELDGRYHCQKAIKPVIEIEFLPGDKNKAQGVTESHQDEWNAYEKHHSLKTIINWRIKKMHINDNKKAYKEEMEEKRVIETEKQKAKSHIGQKINDKFNQLLNGSK